MLLSPKDFSRQVSDTNTVKGVVEVLPGNPCRALNWTQKILKSFNKMSYDQKAVIWRNGNNDLNRMTRQIKKISQISGDLYFQKCIRVLLF